MSTAETFWVDECWQSVPGTFNHLVLDPMVGGIPCIPPKLEETEWSKGQFPLEIWTNSSINFGKRKRFKLMDRLSPTKFVRRNLSPDEGLRLYDIPPVSTNTLTTEMKKLLISNLNTPLKVVSPIAQCLGKWIQRNAEAGGYFLSHRCLKGRPLQGKSHLQRNRRRMPTTPVKRHERRLKQG